MSGCRFDPAGMPYPDDGAVGSDGEPAVCGNGSLDQGEACDGDEFGGQTCVSLGFDSGDLACTGACVINSMGCSTCGDDVRQGDEHCDGVDLDDKNCEVLGFDGGSLSCGPGCLFNTDLCTGSGCGDGVIDIGEDCDGLNLDGRTCATEGFTGGVLTCDVTCQLDVTGCDTCGDGIQTGLEQCDGTDLDGVTCVTLLHDGGNLTCGTGCVFDESGCADCGNGVAELGEACDGADLSGEDCTTQGTFTGGILTCGPTCAFVTSACTTCGDGIIESGEECDDATANSDVVPDACRMNCMEAHCGDGVCDTADLGGNCPQDCKVVAFADDFEGAWPDGWTTGDQYPEVWESGVDTWAPTTNEFHSGAHSLWCAGDGDQTSYYDNNMGAWANHEVDLSGAAGLDVHFDLWLLVDVATSSDSLTVSYNYLGGSNWNTLETISAGTSGWEFRSYNISAAAGYGNVLISFYFYSNGLLRAEPGAVVDDVEVWY